MVAADNILIQFHFVTVRHITFQYEFSQEIHVAAISRKIIFSTKKIVLPLPILWRSLYTVEFDARNLRL